MINYKYIILGGGTCAGYAADEAVKIGINKGEMAIISAEQSLPPDRPPFSKGFLRGDMEESDVFINNEKFYSENGIDLFLDTRIEEIDFNNKTLKTEDKNFGYKNLLIATGSEVNKFTIPGSDLDNIHYLRTLSDSKAIKKAAGDASSIVVIGGMFIGTETAASLAMTGAKVTLVFPESRVLEHFTNNTISEYIGNYLSKLGVDIITGTGIESFTGKNKVESVTLKNGDNLESDLVVAGIGVKPATSLFGNSPIETDNGVLVNEYTETNLENVYAAGDVARFPDQVFDMKRHIEHWENAFEQGKIAASNMLGKRKKYKFFPYFFSDVGDVSYEYFGDKADADRDILRGNPDEGDFAVFFLRKDILKAAFLTASRPDSERELVRKWITEKIPVNDDILISEESEFSSASKE